VDAAEQKSFSRQMNDVMKKVRASDLNKLLKKGNPKSEFVVEMPVGKFILKGIFDCLFRNSRQEWEIIDYKTNRISEAEIPGMTKKYEFQMRCYALLLSYLFPKQKEFPVNLYFLEPDKMVRKVYQLLQIEATRAEVNKLMENLFLLENKLFYTFP
jgi:ATP-dependent exoDNAse (exonuclease V) beta subunit